MDITWVRSQQDIFPVRNNLIQFSQFDSLGCTPRDSYNFKDIGEIAHICGQSRIWGGMHFRAAVPEAEQLCKGIGLAAYEEVRVLRGGDGNKDWSGSEWVLGDPRPQYKK